MCQVAGATIQRLLQRQHGRESRMHAAIEHVHDWVCRYYDSTVIDVGSGEKWFCSASEAEKAGWRASRA
jgi:hypothetical protein